MPESLKIRPVGAAGRGRSGSLFWIMVWKVKKVFIIFNLFFFVVVDAVLSKCNDVDDTDLMTDIFATLFGTRCVVRNGNSSVKGQSKTAINSACT